jgi:hypothetical protein
MSDSQFKVYLPKEIAEELASRCHEFGLEPDRVVAAIVLQFLNSEADDENLCCNRLDQLHHWERGDRTFHRWTAFPKGSSSDPNDDDDRDELGFQF